MRLCKSGSPCEGLVRDRSSKVMRGQDGTVVDEVGGRDGPVTEVDLENPAIGGPEGPNEPPESWRLEGRFVMEME